VTLLGALGSRLEERLKSRSDAIVICVPTLSAYDLVVLLTAHPEFELARLVRDARLVLDTRNATGALGDIRHVIKI